MLIAKYGLRNGYYRQQSNHLVPRLGLRTLDITPPVKGSGSTAIEVLRSSKALFMKLKALRDIFIRLWLRIKVRLRDKNFRISSNTAVLPMHHFRGDRWMRNPRIESEEFRLRNCSSFEGDDCSRPYQGVFIKRLHEN